MEALADGDTDGAGGAEMSLLLAALVLVVVFVLVNRLGVTG